MFDNGFPFVCDDTVNRVISIIPPKTYSNVNFVTSDTGDVIYFVEGTQISFPYRFYSIDIEDFVLLELSYTERMILHCIYTRSCDGYVREKHIKALLKEDFPGWAIP